MVSRNLVICDQEVRYAAALAEVFMKAKELALGVQVCNSVEQTVKLQEESPVDILLIGSSYPVEDRKKIKAGNVFVLHSRKMQHMRQMRNLSISTSPERPLWER